MLHEVDSINSFELSQILGKDHNSVRAAIERCTARGFIEVFGPIKIDVEEAYRAIQVYVLDRDDSIELCDRTSRWDDQLIRKYWADKDQEKASQQAMSKEPVDSRTAILAAMQEVMDSMAKLQRTLHEHL